MSPMIDGRVSFEKYPNGASMMENFIPTTQGPNVRRAGFRFVGEVKDSSRRVLITQFEYSVEQAYILEFGHYYVRFYTWDATTKVRGILAVGGVPVEAVTPYSESDLYNPDGTSRLRFAQSGDFLYIAHPNHQPRILKRVTVTSFTVELFGFKGGPWAVLSTDKELLTASGMTGSITVTSDQDIFLPGHVGSYLLLEASDVLSVPAWEVGKAVAVGKRVRSDNKVYECTVAGTTGSSRPIHTEGSRADGDPGATWAFRDSGYGYVKITGITSAKVVTADVVDRLPIDTTTGGTKRYALCEWSDALGWQSVVGFHRERLWWARGQVAWASVSADFEDYSSRAFGDVTADLAITVRMSSGKLNDIHWLASDRDLIAGTSGGEFSLGDLDSSAPIGPENIRVRLMSEFGSRQIQPIKNAESLLFIQRSGLKARETFYDFGSDGYKSSDTTVLSEHITASGVTQMVFAPDPDQVVWSVLANGRLIGFTWNNEQNVRGWHRQPIGGDGAVESIAVIPAAEGDRSELWAVVRRTINGQTRRYVEYMERPYRLGDAQSSQFYVDSGLTYDGAPTKVISGLDHLEGCEVSVLADGAPHPNVTVVDGAIALQLAASVAQIGLPCPGRYRSMRLEAGAADGTAQGKTKRIHKVVMRFYLTGGGKYGPLKPGGVMDSLLLRTASDKMDQAAPLFSGDKVVAWPDGYNTDAYIGFEVDQPVAATLVSVMPQVVTQDAR